MLDDWRRERRIRRTLRRLAKQRVAGILQPGSVWLVEYAVPRSEKSASHLRTCHLRGWVEIMEDAAPTGQIHPDRQLPPGSPFTSMEPVYGLTDAGWDEIRRTHQWV